MSQSIAEEDYNLPEYKPDIKYAIKSHGNIVVEEVVPEEEYVSVKGKMQFAILYQGEGGGEPGRPGKRIHLFYGAPACRGGYAVGKT